MALSKILNHVYDYMEPLVTILDIASASIILWGFFIGFAKFLHIEFFRSNTRYMQYQELRRTVGIYIILGLEFMVVSDLLHTIQESRDYKSIIILGALVVIRTIISYFLGKEMKEAAEEEREFSLGLASVSDKAAKVVDSASQGTNSEGSDAPKAAAKKKASE